MDTQILLNLNFDGGVFFDSVMWFFTSKLAFIIIGAVMAYLLYRILPLKAFWLSLLFAGLVVLLADQTANFFKHNIAFLRPTHTEDLKGLLHTVNGYTGGVFGTVSGHAANSFGLALYGALIIRKRWAIILFFSFAAITSYSRIYLGVHFPSQICYGILTGLLAGGISYYAFKYTVKRIRRHDNKRTL